MEPKYQLVIAGKNIVLNAKGFIEELAYDPVLQEQELSLTKGIDELNNVFGSPALLATVHNGQPIVIDGQSKELSQQLETALRQFTSTSGTDALSVFLTKEGKFAAYHYFRDGKLLRSVDKAGSEPQTDGIDIPYESNGTDPYLVLTAFCDSWLVLQQLPWTVYRLESKLAHEQ